MWGIMLNTLVYFEFLVREKTLSKINCRTCGRFKNTELVYTCIIKLSQKLGWQMLKEGTYTHANTYVKEHKLAEENVFERVSLFKTNKNLWKTYIHIKNLRKSTLRHLKERGGAHKTHTHIHTLTHAIYDEDRVRAARKENENDRKKSTHSKRARTGS